MEGMADLQLLLSDGIQVPAFRVILACRSDVFRRMLYGDFHESASEQITLDFNSEVLTAVVEFCMTDDVRHFDGRSDEPAARDMVQLLACADFLDLPYL